MVQFFDQPLAVRISSVGFVSFPDRDLDRLEIGGTLSWGPPFDVTYNQAGAARAAYHLLEWVRICRDSSCISGRFGFCCQTCSRTSWRQGVLQCRLGGVNFPSLGVFRGPPLGCLQQRKRSTDRTTWCTWQPPRLVAEDLQPPSAPCKQKMVLSTGCETF